MKMKETVEIKIGEKVVTVDATALFSLVVKGHHALFRAAIDFAKAGKYTKADIYRERYENTREAVNALGDYVYELLNK